ncbi:MAG TPA: hypothetical protein VND64_12990 [Pirellulales bacterium]|nr:hypothetical protein [Pirellulales bacterium]
MNRSVGGRPVSSRLVSRRLTLHADDELDQWDRLALRLHNAVPLSVRSPVTRDLDHRQWARRLRPSRPLGPRSDLAPLRKSMVKADLSRLKRELEAAIARGCEACVLAIAV